MTGVGIRQGGIGWTDTKRQKVPRRRQYGNADGAAINGGNPMTSPNPTPTP